MVYQRTQILMTPEQYQTLKEIAKQERRSFSEVARQTIARGLAICEDTDDIWDRRVKALESMRQIREEGKQRYGTMDLGLVSEMWDEREAHREYSGSGE
ncbi:MAG: hypothetical protein H8D37_05890 [Chloroflexi bacterium]|nr:hypothetical protein [Chloroflexota bacterium]